MPDLVLYLLTHSRETHKTTNTGALVMQALAGHAHIRVEFIEWKRKEPDEQLLALSARHQLGLIYPLSSETAQACYLLQQGDYQPQNAAAFDERVQRRTGQQKHWLILDATWQEAAKMLRQSPYLQSCYRIAIKTDTPSEYKLRRNQKEGALCTAEVVMELLLQCGYADEKEQLMLLFNELNRR